MAAKELRNSYPAKTWRERESKAQIGAPEAAQSPLAVLNPSVVTRTYSGVEFQQQRLGLIPENELIALLKPYIDRAQEDGKLDFKALWPLLLGATSDAGDAGVKFAEFYTKFSAGLLTLSFTLPKDVLLEALALIFGVEDDDAERGEALKRALRHDLNRREFNDIIATFIAQCDLKGLVDSFVPLAASLLNWAPTIEQHANVVSTTSEEQ